LPLIIARLGDLVYGNEGVFLVDGDLDIVADNGFAAFSWRP